MRPVMDFIYDDLECLDMVVDFGFGVARILFDDNDIVRQRLSAYDVSCVILSVDYAYGNKKVLYFETRQDMQPKFILELSQSVIALVLSY